MIYAPRPLPRVSPVLRRHRLPTPYRVLLPLFTLLPIPIFVLAILLGRGFSPALLDPRFWLPCLIALIPAVYWWREGVDVLAGGIIRRMHVPRYYPYAALSDWRYASREGVLTVWDADGGKALECHGAHLTEFDQLVDTLRENIGTGG
ncbi:MAG: hypothetical protein KME04_19600 [Pleurocapsa minor GSE-CHR-MK-17-07R]|jgi:hypothetical protein|nr:hypothetical protein [Pleurocapsa minor GSE-CHR-MK 17-07R]